GVSRCRAAAHSRFTFARHANSIARIAHCSYLHGQCLGLLYPSMTATSGAGIRNYRTATMTCGAGLLYREESLLHAHLTVAATGGTGNRFTACFGATASADFTRNQSRHFDLYRATFYRFFKTEVECITQIRATTRTTATATTSACRTENITKYIAKYIAEVS